MSLKVVSWNTEGRLTRFTKRGRGSPENIVDTLRKLNADVVFLAEASDKDDIEPEIVKQLCALRYTVYTVNYDETRDRQWAAEKEPNMKLLSRLPVSDFRQVRLGDMRNCLVADIEISESGKSLRIFGVHLDDRSETSRLKQIDDLFPHIKASPIPVLVAGDYNAMHTNTLPSVMFRSGLFRLLGTRWPSFRTRDMLRRISEMASGTTLAKLEAESQMVDADPRHRPTATPKMRHQEWAPSIRLGQIDHMFVTTNIKVDDFRVGSDGGSDHRPISATLSISTA